MKIAIDIRLIGKKRTGDEVVFFNLVKNLAKIDHANEYFLFTDRDLQKDPDLAAEIAKLELGRNFRVVFINTPNRFWWNLWALPRYLQKNPVDVFHTQYIAPFWLPRKIKLVLTIHDISFNFFPQFIKSSDLFFLKNLIPRSIRRADKIITVSESEKQNIIDYYKIPEKKVKFTYNGVDFERFNRKISEEEKENVRKKYSLPQKFLLYIGTMQPRKNLPVAIEATKDIAIKLVIPGNRNAHNFDKKIDEVIGINNLQEKIIFPGWIEEEDKPAIIQMAKCFVFPSLYEGFGIPGIEAMASGTPVVASNIPVFREIFQDAALLSNPQNSEEFSQNIKKVLGNIELRNKMIEKGGETAQNFTWQKNAEKTKKIYEELAK
ncbi:MAG: glycosyltransferase family 1 protein [Candidatus Moranbacteria bacterium]|nr:glycosyltransferase family 1 protein [Candidatus Moranbacteria bacterium]